MHMGCPRKPGPIHLATRPNFDSVSSSDQNVVIAGPGNMPPAWDPGQPDTGVRFTHSWAGSFPTEKPVPREIQTVGILKEMGIPYHLTCLLRNLYAGQEATGEPEMEQQTTSKSRTAYVKAVHCHPAYLTSMKSTSYKMPGWMKQKLE